MNFSRRHICSASLLPAFLFLALLASAISKAPLLQEQLRKKAQYYYLEGARWNSLDSTLVAHEYFKKAHLIDPSYPEASVAYGLMQLTNPDDDRRSDEECFASLALMKQYVDIYPDDYNWVSLYALLNSQLDSAAESIRVIKRLYNLQPQRTALLSYLADLFRIQQQPDSSLFYLSQFEKFEGRNAQTTIAKASILLNMRDSLAVIAEIDSLIADNPKNPAAVALKGEAYYILARPDSALHYLLLAEKMAPESGTQKLTLANFYLSQGDSVAYDNKIYEALISEDFDVDAKTDIVADYLQKLINKKQNNERGDYLFSVLRNQYPHDPQVLYLAARYNAAKGDYNQALENLQYAIDLDPEDAEKPEAKISYLISDNRPKEAIEAYNEYFHSKHSPKPSTRLLLSTAASMAKEYSIADSILTVLLHEELPTVNPTDSVIDRNLLLRQPYEGLIRISTILTLLGDNYFNAHKVQEALKAYRLSLSVFPDNPAALNNLAYQLSEYDGDLLEAQGFSKRALALDPENPTYLDTYAWILFKLGDFDKALTFQETAINLAVQNNYEDAELYTHLAKILDALNRHPEAVEAQAKANELTHKNEPISPSSKTKSKNQSKQKQKSKKGAKRNK